MGMRRDQNLQKSKRNPNENWMYEKLLKTNLKWTRNAIWGHRLFDFWCAGLGIAVEVDGPEHAKPYDDYRDEYNLRRSGILVFHVRNLNESDAQSVMAAILNAEAWKDRRSRLGITGSKRQRRHLVVQAKSHAEFDFVNSV